MVRKELMHRQGWEAKKVDTTPLCNPDRQRRGCGVSLDTATGRLYEKEGKKRRSLIQG